MHSGLAHTPSPYLISSTSKWVRCEQGRRVLAQSLDVWAGALASNTPCATRGKPAPSPPSHCGGALVLAWCVAETECDSSRKLSPRLTRGQVKKLCKTKGQHPL